MFSTSQISISCVLVLGLPLRFLSSSLSLFFSLVNYQVCRMLKRTYSGSLEQAEFNWSKHCKKNSYLASSRSSFFILNCRLVTGNKNAIRNGASLTKFLGLSMCACFVNGKQIEVNHNIHFSIRHPLSPPVLTNRVLMPPLTHHPKCIESSTGRCNDRISTNYGARSFT